jgi:amidophosphoribosyltransferase
MDFADEEQLVAASRTVAEVQEQIGATSLAYISLEGVQAATMRPENEFCRACFTRTYPTRVPAGKTLAKFRFEPSRT